MAAKKRARGKRAGSSAKSRKSAFAKSPGLALAREAGKHFGSRLLKAAAEAAFKHFTGKAVASADTGPRAHRVVYVHGIGNKPIASILKCQWDTALFGFDLGDRSRLAYWVNRERFPDPEAGSCASGDLSDGDDAEAPAGPGAQSVGDEKNWLEADIAALAQNTEQRDLLRKLAADMTTKAASGPDKTARQVGAKVLPLPAFMRRWITRRLTKAFLKDVHELFFVPERRQVMLQSLTERLDAGGGPFVVVGHSQGSMVAYLALSMMTNPEVKIPLLVTIGSPLGLTEVQDQLKKLLGTNKLAVPPVVERWVNVADRLDPVALDANICNDFAPSGSVKVEDFRVSNPDSPRHPHSSTGYLRTEPVRVSVREAIDIALFQPVSDFVVAKDMVRELEDGGLEDRHEVLIELSEHGGQSRTLDEVRGAVVATISGIQKKRGRDEADYALDELERFISVQLTRDETETLASSLGGKAGNAIRHIWKNARKIALLETSINTLQVRPAHNAYRAYGSEISWAVLDSGIYEKHPHFLDDKGKPRNLLATYDCTRKGALQAGPAPDVYGHGTHVAGIIAGQFERDGRSIVGMAPEARLHIYKVLDDSGAGKDSWIIKALDHIARTNERAGELAIHGVNLSLGGAFDPGVYSCGHTPLCRELRRLWRQGVVLVIAAGNEGYAVLQSDEGEIQANMPLTIGDPANLEESIVVGSVHKSKPHIYGGSYFSSRGPTADGRQKPDVVAPGERILSCRHQPEGKGKSIDELYLEMSGTSMAAPHISGLVASFLSIHREFVGYPDKVKEKLLAACTDLKREPAQQGAGMPNLVRMLVSS
jgi:hypothetical protein